MTDRITVLPSAMDDLSELPQAVADTFYSAKDTAETNMGLGADPGQVFEKYMSGNLHPFLQMTLGRDYRAWFLEGTYLAELDDELVYCLKVMTANEAHELADRISDSLAFARRVLG